jgi:hypothetical protein
MGMNKYLKRLLLTVLSLVLLAAGLVGCYHWRKYYNQKLAKTDFVKFSAACDTVSVVTEMPMIKLLNFNKSETSRLKYYLIRQGKVRKDTTIRTENDNTANALYAQLPFDRFLKTDTIVVETQGSNKRWYNIAGFSHYAYLHYGMMGYLGTCDCRLNNDHLMVNGTKSDGSLIKQNGIKGSFRHQQ